ncbi:hypothetical protein U729_2626 [Clostridium baratii str. Sullivan]|uniref:RiboL-PSP-HEPN domain-containing protein n=1 Tax=Clostridium baratii str. Sullivan TaxID=1415775 RepID=A0A0A7FWD3_9CLOT|nr:MAE_28990/MAE_18760 family HEPN-like nuclease [Clostridium baratii]AIY83873.1 hypothetical protein U729_2626 [Clostridium baratii str. Sullivan]
MYKENFQKFRTERRNKIITMDTIIRNNDDLKEGEKDVLLRGFIVLIYAFWEGNYKEIQKLFFCILKEKKIKELPHKIKNKVLIELATNQRERNKKISEIEDCKQIDEINSKIIMALESKLSDYSQCDRLCHHFKENSNNPNYTILTNMLSKYNITLKKLIKQMIEEYSIPDNFEDRLNFIIKSRNNIAHGVENISDYEEMIISNFIRKEDATIIDVSDFLNETTFYIDLLYNEIFSEFENKYMHIE